MRTVTAIALFTMVLMTSSANAITNGFQGEYAPANWTLSTDDNELLDLTSVPNSISLTGENDVSNSNATQTTYTIVMPASGTIIFDWSWFTPDGSPELDDGGFLINGVRSPLSDDTASSSGSQSVELLIGEIFGFYSDTDDSLGGAGTLTIRNFKGPSSPNVIPEPTTALLGVMGLASLGAIMRRRRR